jgi:hypothetical protein
MDAARDLADVLDREKRAAANADVDALLELQSEKRAALDRLYASAPSADVLEPLRKAAQGNVALIRHLVVCLRGVVGGEGAVYGPSGEACPADVRSERGHG